MFRISFTLCIGKTMTFDSGFRVLGLPNLPLLPTFMGPLHCFVFFSLVIVAKLSFSPYLPNTPLSPTFMCPFTALCFASLSIVGKLSFSPYSQISLLWPTFMGPLHCFVFFLVVDCGKIVIFAIFAKFAAFANFYGPPSLLCVFPRW